MLLAHIGVLIKKEQEQEQEQARREKACKEDEAFEDGTPEEPCACECYTEEK